MGGGMGSCMLSESLSLSLLWYGGSEAPYWRWCGWCWWWWPSFPAIERATVERSSSEGGVVKWDCPCPCPLALAVEVVRAFLVFAVELGVVELARLPCGFPPGFRTGFVRSQWTPRLTHLPHLPSASKSSRPGTHSKRGSAPARRASERVDAGGSESVHFFFMPLHEKQPE
jgi:hypothetical protein